MSLPFVREDTKLFQSDIHGESRQRSTQCNYSGNNSVGKLIQVHSPRADKFPFKELQASVYKGLTNKPKTKSEMSALTSK